jgi:3-oxoadipate enol-lactonase
VIAGSGDAGIPPERAAELQAAIPAARIGILEAAHLSNIEACDGFNAAVLTHLDVSS